MTFALVSMVAIAQPHQRGHHGHSIEKFQSELNLTDAQLDELKVLKEDMHDLKAEFRASGERPSHEERDVIRQQHREKILAILTPDQITKLESLKATHKEERKNYFKENKAQFKEAKHELKAYHQNEVMPVLLKQRAKLEKEISRKDSKEIAKLRSIVGKFKSEKKTELKAKKEAWKKEKDQLSREEKMAKKEDFFGHKKRGYHSKFGLIEDFEEQFPKEAAQLQTLEAKYQADIIRLMDEIAAERTKWKAKKEASHIAKFHGHKKKCDQSKDCKNGKAHDDHKNGANRKVAHGEQMEKLKRIKFLLMDPKMETEVESTAPFRSESVHNTKIFPNPATNNQTLEFEITESGNVLVEIIDKKGKVIKQVYNGHLDKGVQSINVDITDLKGYVFYYRITDRSGTSSTKFMTKK